jgi:L-iditol 2-dehydrogenase
MKGLFKTAPGSGNMELRETPVPQINDQEVLVEVRAAGVCGSDLHIHDGDINVPMKPPMITGHEFSGVIASIGKDVSGWKPGERVTAEPTYSACGVCRYCHSGFYNLCLERRILGFWADGAFAEFIKVPSRRLHRLPQSVSFRGAAMTEPLACCVHAVLELTGISTGQTVAISGPGTIGLLCLQLVVLSGGSAVLLGTGTDRARLDLGRKLGAERTIDIESEDPWEVIGPMTSGMGADVYLECSGAPPAAATGLQLVRKQGHYTQIGLYGKPISLDFEKVALKELKVTGSFAQKWSAWKTALALLEKERINPELLVSHTFHLNDWKKAFETLRRKEGVKVILIPGDKQGGNQ